MEMGAWNKKAERAHNSFYHFKLGGRYKKRASCLIPVIILSALALLFSPCLLVSADDPASPNTFEIRSVLSCRHIIETDDFILAVHYEIAYDNEEEQPTTPVDKLFNFRIMDTTGTNLIGSAKPYPYNNLGYDEGAVAFYFSADDAPDWGESYIVKIQGNPQYFSSPPVVSYTMTLGDYSIYDTQEENCDLLGDYVIDIARDLEINWQTEMVIDTGEKVVLSSTGETYFLETIRGIKQMIPQIFSTSVLDPDYTSEEQGMEQAEAWATRYEGTWLGDALENLGELLGVQWNIITGIGVLILITGLYILCQMKFQTTSPAAVPASLVLLGATLMGFVAPVMMAIMTLMVVLFSGYILFVRSG